ncbi:MAG TPA: RHS repeat-associated core domain-containing protein, partial [Polyangiaceae bacterium]|nr:RHS repeat-associated core domain-containing protein [Polyangiaceae bacterium]
KKNGATYARYIYRNGLSPVAVLDSSGELAARFVYASRPNTPDFMVLANGTVYKFISDQRGSPRVIANAATGAIAQRIDYDEFGNQTMPVNSGAFPTWMQPFGFAGGLYDEDTGLVRFGARDYEAQTGRWLAKDLALFGGGQANLYVYAGNDPVNGADPSGLWNVFGWRSLSLPLGGIGPVHVEGEAVGIIGYDSSSSSRWYGSLIAAGGGEVDVKGVRADGFYGKEWSTPLAGGGVTSNGIALGGVSFPVPFLAPGLDGTVGLYRTSGAEWGFYGGVGAGVLGANSAAGAGFVLPGWLQGMLERGLHGLVRKICP